MKQFQNVLNIALRLAKWAGVIYIVVEGLEGIVKKLNDKYGDNQLQESKEQA